VYQGESGFGSSSLEGGTSGSGEDDEENDASEQKDKLAETGAPPIPAKDSPQLFCSVDSPPEFSSDGGLEPILVDDDGLIVRCMLQLQNLFPKRCTTLLLLKHQRFTSPPPSLYVKP
jgi:hypothetical protein